MKRVALVAIWLVLAVSLSALAWTMLDSADRQVADGPAVTPLTVVDGSTSTVDAGSSSTTSTLGGTATTSASPSGSASTSPVPSTTSIPSTTSTSTSTSSSSSTTSSTTTTQVAGPFVTATIPCDGGVVIVAHRDPEVRLESATPAAGFEMDIDKDGPDEVRIEFENDNSDDRCEIRVRYASGALSIDVDEG